MSERTESENRIRDACLQLELALTNFECDDEANQKAQAEREKLKRLREQLEEIRKQLVGLST